MFKQDSRSICSVLSIGLYQPMACRMLYRSTQPTVYQVQYKCQPAHLLPGEAVLGSYPEPELGCQLAATYAMPSHCVKVPVHLLQGETAPQDSPCAGHTA